MEALADTLIIPIKGLPKGESTFHFAIDGSFFSKFGNTRIKDADCSVKVSARRRSTMMEIVCRIGGFVVVECDRCLDDLPLKVDVERMLTVGFGAVDVDDAADEDDMMVVSSSDSVISLDQFVYDYVCLSLPIVMVHPEGRCNPQMLARLESGSHASEEHAEGNNPFGKLKEMLKK
jgi:Predicted metal-binding, possibly nucleic acid-binding protein